MFSGAYNIFRLFFLSQSKSKLCVPSNVDMSSEQSQYNDRNKIFFLRIKNNFFYYKSNTKYKFKKWKIYLNFFERMMIIRYTNKSQYSLAHINMMGL